MIILIVITSVLIVGIIIMTIIIIIITSILMISSITVVIRALFSFLLITFVQYILCIGYVCIYIYTCIRIYVYTYWWVRPPYVQSSVKSLSTCDRAHGKTPWQEQWLPTPVGWWLVRGLYWPIYIILYYIYNIENIRIHWTKPIIWAYQPFLCTADVPTQVISHDWKWNLHVWEEIKGLAGPLPTSGSTPILYVKGAHHSKPQTSF